MLYNSYSLANILSLSEVAEKYRIIMDMVASPSIRVHLGSDRVLIFEQCGSGLYFFDTSDMDKSKQSVSNNSFLSTFAINEQHFTRKEIEQADKARILKAHLGWPATDDFKRLVAENFLINCDITVDDVSRAVVIYGPSEPMLKCKMFRRRPGHVADIPRVPLPPLIIEHFPSDVLDMDFFFVNGLGFLYTITRKCKFKTV